MGWQWTDAPAAPCSNCVRWRPATDPDGCEYEGPWEPHLPDGSVPSLIRWETCADCEAAIAAMRSTR